MSSLRIILTTIFSLCALPAWAAKYSDCAKALMLLSNSQVHEESDLKIRLATLDDLEAILAQVYDPNRRDDSVQVPRAAYANALPYNGQVDGGRSNVILTIRDRDENFLGSITLKVTKGHPTKIGYGILREYWGQGLATRASRIVIDQIFREARRETAFWADVGADHTRSIRVLEKLGFKLGSITGDPPNAKYFLYRKAWQQRQ